MKKITIVKSPERIDADADKGLTYEQARERRLAGLSNIPVEPPSKSLWEIIAENTFTYFNFIFTVLAGLIIYAGTYRDVTFMPIIIANTLIGIIQELRSKKVLDKLTMMNAPETTVIRDGKEISLPSKDIVLDDIAIFRAGNQISADAVVIDGNIAVNESLLTGESDEIYKSAGDSLMSGSFVVSGSCRARLEKVGAESYISKLTSQAKKQKKGERSEMIRSLNKIVKIAGVMIIPIGILLFCQQHFLEMNDISSSIQAMVAAVLGMIPEGLFLLASTTLVVSTMRLANNKVLVHDMKCIETLARADVLCVDKTGTITESKMSVNGIIPVAELSEDELIPLISDFTVAQSADNATMIAMKNYFHKPTGQKIKSYTGFSSDFKYSSTTLESGAYILGASEFVLKNNISAYSDIISENSSKGMRVLAFCRYSGIPDGKALTAETELLCFVLITNPIRENAPETFRFFAEQGVQIKVISGDNPLTVSQIAKLAEIANAGDYVDASTLKTDEAIENAVNNYTVFGRVTPEQKRKIVRALKKSGHTVAMTGDGVNDVLALKSADCSVAMASGSEAAAQVSQLVLLESDFSKMPDVVMEGRQTVNNLERSGSLFLIKNIFSLIMSLVSIFCGITYPLKPAHISLVSVFTIGLPGLCLSQIPNRNLIKGNFMSNILLKALPAGLTDAIIVTFMIIFGNIFNSSQEDISTASTILLSVVGMMALLRISKPMNSIKLAIWLICGLLLTFSMIFLSRFFSVSGMSIQCILLCINFSIIAEPTLRYLTIITEKIKVRH